MSTVNGNIGLSVNSLVEGDLETVNGDITVPDGEIKGSVTTQNGDVSLSGNTRIYGDIVFEETENGWMKNKSEQPVLSITDDVVVNGNIILERAVVLELANPALESKVIRRKQQPQLIPAGRTEIHLPGLFNHLPVNLTSSQTRR